MNFIINNSSIHWRSSHIHYRASSTHWRAIASRAPSNKQPQSFRTRCNRARVARLVSSGTIDLVSGTNLYDSTAQDVIAGYQYRLCMTTHDSIGRKRYELSNHLGNVLVAISDRKMQVDAGSDGVYDYFLPDVWVTNDYYPYHSVMPGRSYNSNAYRFGGAGGQEKDDEITGVTGSHYTAEYWMYDSRIGRRWNVDPVDKPWESSYAAFANNPIWFIDPDGADVVNGDRIIADKQKEKSDNANNDLTDIMSKNSITTDTKRSDFLNSGGTKETWKKYKLAKRTAKDELKKYNRLNCIANQTQDIIDKWKIESPDVFNEVDGQKVDFVLFSSDMTLQDVKGGVTPAYIGTPNAPTLYSRDINQANALTVRIDNNVNISTKDGTGQYNLNHEAGHFLYIVKFTSEYIKFRLNESAAGISNQGGHSKGDESGKVANKYGSTKNKVYKIKLKGN